MVKPDRTLVELWIGEILFGLLAQIPAFFLGQKILGTYTIGLWCGVILSVLCSYHMWWTLLRAAQMGERAAGRMAGGNYLVRYFAIILLFLALYKTGVGSPFAAFLGYMSMKAGAYMQPFVHKCLNRITGQSDPIPEPEEGYRITETGECVKVEEAEQTGTEQE